ncbi:ribose-5-phosphate isomerase [Aureococcus anophagefferens]|uniref:ribose-5-phosphate isomerase n=1 Tax=Aureococcus anophagefferens TaxID=44056 RepID=F0YD86_AURAN|nr:ribose 5-phosphate isomerase [Aureococcus anophagefferens]EGB07017.1 ribose 5-phosphate isomerase [Aureococcus anophagefferens]KAH8068536.1 ribose-5-phosphate isomerase [Aureococcus anophagefferens]|eukprot:XP_009038255.1 ribose 5-phosphate isomerase [Aureococcus anophagefferens]
MILGVGTGKTVELCLRRIADKLERGALKDVLCLPTSDATARLLETLKLPTLRHDSDASVDLAIGGCDAVDGQKHVLKGGKGAMLREKLLRDAAKAWVVCCAEGKVCDAVGSTYPIPVAPVGVRARKLANLPSLQPAVARLRVGAAPAGFPGCAMPGDDGAAVYKTDNGNLIVDLFLEAPLRDVRRAADDLSRTAGVVEHGLLPADENPPIVVVGRADGTATRL